MWRHRPAGARVGQRLQIAQAPREVNTYIDREPDTERVSHADLEHRAEPGGAGNTPEEEICGGPDTCPRQICQLLKRGSTGSARDIPMNT